MSVLPTILVWAALGVAFAAAPLRAQDEPPPPAQPWGGAPGDSGVGAFLRSLSDSTDAYFGKTAAPADTAGLDSVLAYRLSNPESIALPRRRTLELPFPVIAYNRVDAAVWGARWGIGEPRGTGRLVGQLAYATGPDEWLGLGRYVRRFATQTALWTGDLVWEKRTYRMSGDLAASSFATLRSLLNGSDRNSYLRREGPRFELRRESQRATLQVGYRDQLEDSLTVTELWNLLNKEPALPFNLPARPGRARAFSFAAGVSTGSWPLQVWLEHETSSRQLGSDFEYRRWRGVAGAVVPLNSWSAIALQGDYSRLELDPVSQASFQLGGTQTLRSLKGGSLAGTRETFGRAELVLAPNLLELARLPHPSLLNLQISSYLASGAVWGENPYTGADLGGDAFPDPEAWRHEIGLGLLYRPGVPDPQGFLRLDFAWPVGPHGGPRRMVLGYGNLLNLLPVIGR
jgi:hypothetical protein